MLIREVLTVKADQLITTTPNTLIPDAINMMASQDIGSLIIMDAGHMVGLITERDILRALGKKGCRCQGDLDRRSAAGHQADCDQDRAATDHSCAAPHAPGTGQGAHHACQRATGLAHGIR